MSLIICSGEAEIGVRLGRNHCSDTAEFGVRDNPKWVFGRNRNQCSASAEIGVRAEPKYTLLSLGDFEQEVIQMNSQQFFSSGLSFGIYITAKFNKSWWKYKHSRAYRAVMMDIGHVSQTLQLCATACDLNTWVTGEFADDKVCEFLKIEDVCENPLLFVGAGFSNRETFPSELLS